MLFSSDFLTGMKSKYDVDRIKGGVFGVRSDRGGGGEMKKARMEEDQEAREADPAAAARRRWRRRGDDRGGEAAAGAAPGVEEQAEAARGGHARGRALAAMRPHILEIPAATTSPTPSPASPAAAPRRLRPRRHRRRRQRHPAPALLLAVSGAGAAGATVGFRAGSRSCRCRRRSSPAVAALSPASAAAAAAGALSISLAGPQGQVVGGTVAGPLVAAGTVTVVAAAFSNPTFHRLPAEDDASPPPPLLSGDADSHHDREIPDHHHPHHHHHPPPQPMAPGDQSCGMSIYSGHLPRMSFWRPPPPSASAALLINSPESLPRHIVSSSDLSLSLSPLSLSPLASRLPIMIKSSVQEQDNTKPTFFLGKSKMVESLYDAVMGDEGDFHKLTKASETVSPADIDGARLSSLA
uniref:Uncharacterized protein n=1 Tax=Ananas comosus var. bracteatus TaxID=296719 RepID=A0A6V7P6H6_ANACO|nr:unnamed protein product [Ananas comosus var. bracteatus]